MKISLLIISLLLGIVSYSQPRIFNLSLTDSSMNIVYAGVENKIIIQGFTPSKTRRVIGVNAFLTPVNNDRYLLQPSKGDSCIIYCYNNDSIVLRKAFSIHQIPMPAAKLGNIETSIATIKEILSNAMVSIELPGCYYKHSFTLLSYKFRIENDATGYKYARRNYTARFTDEQKKLLKNCTPGTTIILDEVRVRSSAGDGSALSTFVVVK